ncbi:MAG: heme anaerobic degradation radical SAM methyltransferase ChuW/HutW [Deefgea sp.]
MSSFTHDLNRWLQPNDALPTAFTERKALMPMWGAQMVPPTAWPAITQRIISTPINSSTLAYFHIPFCANRCVFCGFYRNAWQAQHGAPYVDRLIAELELEASQRPVGGSIDAVYFGGGTPTALSEADLCRLLAAVRRTLPLTDDCEITIEGRISHFSLAKAQACLAAGANRISIGVQSFDSQLRRRLGRQHSGDDAAAYLRQLCSQTDAVIVADLMFGLPGQDDAKWAHDLDVALSLGLSGLDLYAFNCFPNLPINRMLEKGALPPLPNLATQSRHYAYAVRRLMDAGWTQLSNSHFASPNPSPNRRERNRYNQAIKTGQDCLAFGSGAGGCHAGFSYQVQGNLDDYLATPLDQKPIAFLAATSPQKQAFGLIQGALEAGQFASALFAPYPALIVQLHEWQQQGLLTISQDQITLTIGGRFWAPTLIRELAQLISPPEEQQCPPHAMPHQHPNLHKTSNKKPQSLNA